jgi:hypothetical protein
MQCPTEEKNKCFQTPADQTTFQICCRQVYLITNKLLANTSRHKNIAIYIIVYISFSVPPLVLPSYVSFFFLFICPLSSFLCFNFFFPPLFCLFFYCPSFSPFFFHLGFCLYFSAPMGFISSLPQLAWDQKAWLLLFII